MGVGWCVLFVWLLVGLVLWDGFAGDLGGFWVVRLPAGFVVILVVVWVLFVCLPGLCSLCGLT